MVSGVRSYIMAPVQSIRPAAPARTASAGRSENAKLASYARYEARRVETYRPYRAMNSVRANVAKNARDVGRQRISPDTMYIERRIDTYA